MEGTRDAIIQAFDQLLDEKPVNKITVKDIVECCGCNRNTFYYHFDDIPAMIDEIMDDMAAQIIRNHFEPGEPMECIRPIVQYGLRNKNKLLHVYRYVPRETFTAYLNRIILRLVQDYIDSATAGNSAHPESAADLAQFYKCAISGLVLDWLDDGMKDDLMALTQRLCVLLRGTGRMALARG